jgi:hypothetical protein
MTDLDLSKLDFSHLEESSKQSFGGHRQLIKQLGHGEIISCESCQQPLQLTLDSAEPAIFCAKGCTRISLELG